uniref:Restriction modification system DNA specificity domain n=1 Tax=Dechloromonas aromatica (strain RCB) TaxID=159087 RepID=Q47GH3_DECAR
MAHGAASQANVSPSQVGGLEIVLPNIEQQRRIASILSTYDDLIENNTRRIAILEEMARRIYEEWFVHFRFPLHEQVKMVESEFGVIPEGWKITSLGEAFNIVLGGTPSRNKSEYWDQGTIPWINSGKVNDLRITTPSEYITDLGLKKSAAKLMPAATTVIAITGATLGQVSYLCTEMSANQSVVGVFDASGKYSEYIYRLIQNRIMAIIQHASGGAQQHINKEIVNDVVLVLPPDDVLSLFNNTALPIGELINTLLHKNANLRTTRDLLLPKLVSGELDVSEIAA